MAIEAVVFDVSGTLLQETAGAWPRVTDRPSPGVEGMLDALRAMGLTIIAASNNPVRANLSASGLLARVDHVVERSDVGVAKRGKAWVPMFESLSGLKANQILYVGDSDNDMITATWGPMIYAHALWSSAPGAYGLRALSPAWVVNTVQHIFRKQHSWYWTLNTVDALGRQVLAMTLLDADGAGSPQVKQRLLWLLKDGIDSLIPGTPMMLSEFVMLHMLTSVYNSNLFGGADFWTTYPGHTGAPNAVMGSFLDVAAKLSRNKYKDDLLVRHTHALKSAAARSSGMIEPLRNQLETVQLGGAYRGKIAGKRVLLLDNFLTYGYTSESGRNLLLNAGASEVVTACVGKYGPNMRVISPSKARWDSFAVSRPSASDFHQTQHTGNSNRDALSEFLLSLRGISNASW